MKPISQWLKKTGSQPSKDLERPAGAPMTSRGADRALSGAHYHDIDPETVPIFKPTWQNSKWRSMNQENRVGVQPLTQTSLGELSVTAESIIDQVASGTDPYRALEVRDRSVREFHDEDDFFDDMADHLHSKGYRQDAQDGPYVPFHNEKLQKTVKIDLRNNSWQHHGWSPRAGVAPEHFGSGSDLDSLKSHIK